MIKKKIQKKLKHYNQKKYHILIIIEFILKFLIKHVQQILLLKKCFDFKVHFIIKNLKKMIKKRKIKIKKNQVYFHILLIQRNTKMDFIIIINLFLKK